MKNKDEQVPCAALVQYFSDIGMAKEWVDEAMSKIDVNQDNYLSWVEFGTKIRLINQLRTAAELATLAAHHRAPKFDLNESPDLTTLVSNKQGTYTKKLSDMFDNEGLEDEEDLWDEEILNIRKVDQELLERSDSNLLGSKRDSEVDRSVTPVMVRRTEENLSSIGSEELDAYEREIPVEIKVELDPTDTMEFALLPDVDNVKVTVNSNESTVNASIEELPQEPKTRSDFADEALNLFAPSSSPKSQVSRPRRRITDNLERTLQNKRKPKRQGSFANVEVKITEPHEETKANIQETIKPKQISSAESEPCVTKSADFVASLIRSTSSIIKRGYTVVELSPELVDQHNRCLEEFKGYVQANIECSQKFGTELPTPPHAVRRFVLRLCGKRTTITTPASARGEHGEDIGKLGMQMHEHLDQFCRKFVASCLKKSGIPETKLDLLLDPINKIGEPVQREPVNPTVCYSSYVLDGYLSSSVMEVTHAAPKSHSDIASTDGGLLSADITSDVPGLEVYDQELKQWIAIEQLVHEYAPKVNKFAIVYWGRAATYLKGPPGFQPCLHRIKNAKERYAIEFKLRATPLTTPCEGPSDQMLLETQLNAVKHIGWVPGNSSSSPSLSSSLSLSSPSLLYGAIFLVGAICGAVIAKLR